MSPNRTELMKICSLFNDNGINKNSDKLKILGSGDIKEKVNIEAVSKVTKEDVRGG